MKKLALFLTILMATGGPTWGDQGLETVVTAMRSTNWDVGPEIAFLQKTTSFRVPDASANLLSATGPYGGAKFAYIFGRDMIKYFEANGYPNLRQQLAGGSTEQLDQIAKKYSFEFVYEGPADQKAWNMFSNYSSLIRDEVFHWGWAPKSGEAHFIVTTTPKAATFSVTTDGKIFKVQNPTLEIPTSAWNKSVRTVLEANGTKANRI